MRVSSKSHAKPMRGVGLFLLIVAFGATTFWAGRTLVATELPASDETEPVTVVVVDGSVEEVYRVSVNVSWEEFRTIRNDLFAGYVTSLSPPDDEGSVVITINEHPVVLIGGDFPMYRSLEQGDQGDDVTQVQDFLIRAGLMTAAPDGKYGPAMGRAVKEWKGTLGLPSPDAGLPLGMLAVVWEQESALVPADGIERGAYVGEGDVIFRVLPSTPTLTAGVSSITEQRIEQSGVDEVEVVIGGQAITMRLGDRQPSEPDKILLGLSTAEKLVGIEPGEEMVLAGTVTVVPHTFGPLVPSLALRNRSGNGAELLTVDGPVEVEVIAEVGGEAIVEGIDVGTEIVLLE